MLESFIIGLHLYTQHIDKGLNNYNPGIYISEQVKPQRCNLAAGTYYNSYKKQSAWVGCTFTNDEKPGFRLTVGAVTGYKGGIKPLFMPQYVAEISKDYSFVASILPSAKAGLGGVHFTIEKKF